MDHSSPYSGNKLFIRRGNVFRRPLIPALGEQTYAPAVAQLNTAIHPRARGIDAAIVPDWSALGHSSPHSGNFTDTGIGGSPHPLIPVLGE